MMEPMGNRAYKLAMSRIEIMQQEAERDRLIAQLEDIGPRRFDRLCIWAGGRVVSLGERLRQHGETRWQPDHSRMLGM